jgi:hypothetical protein
MVVSSVAQHFDLYLTTHNTHNRQTDNIHAPGGIRNHNLSRRAAEDLRLRPRSHWDRQSDRLWKQFDEVIYLLWSTSTSNSRRSRGLHKIYGPQENRVELAVPFPVVYYLFVVPSIALSVVAMHVAEPAGHLFVLVFISETVRAQPAGEWLQRNHSKIP